MRVEVARDLSDSAFEFLRAVWPQVQEWCGGGELIPVESVADEGFTHLLDALAGIDAWQVQADKGIRGIGSRVQWDDGRPGFPYNTFTIRSKRSNGAATEYQKRSEAIETGAYLYPHLTVHAYFDMPRRAGALRSVAMARTKDIFEAIEKGYAWTKSTSNAEFFCVKWRDMQIAKYDVRMLTNLAPVNGTHSISTSINSLATKSPNHRNLSRQEPSLWDLGLGGCNGPDES
jgi:hypothetical protein